MELKKPAVAGTLESSDVQITLRPNPGQGIQIELQSDVKALFGQAIEETVRAVLAEFGVQDALVDVNDKGALDFVIRARMECAVCRAAQVQFNWGKEDPNGGDGTDEDLPLCRGDQPGENHSGGILQRRLSRL